MRSMAAMFAVSAVLLGGPQMFATRIVHPYVHRMVHPHALGVCGRQKECCWRSPVKVRIPAGDDDPQARANAASKTWPGDMILG